MALQDGADRIDARMGAAAGRVRLDGDALEPPCRAERALPGAGIGRRRREGAGEAAPDVLEDLRRAGEAGPGEERGQEAAFGGPAGMDALRAGAVVDEGP